MSVKPRRLANLILFCLLEPKHRLNDAARHTLSLLLLIVLFLTPVFSLGDEKGEETGASASVLVRQNLVEMTREYFQKNSEKISDYTQLADARETSKPKSKLSLDARANENDTYIGLRYSTGWAELGNGMLMLVTPTRINKASGKREWFPAYSHMLREGGLLSPEYGALICAPVNLVGKLFGKDEVLANPWYYNPALTGGVALDQLLLAIAAGGSGGGSSAVPATAPVVQQQSHDNYVAPAAPVTPSTPSAPSAPSAPAQGNDSGGGF